MDCPIACTALFHILPLRPLCGADVRPKFSFQSSMLFGAPAYFRSVYVIQEVLLGSCLWPLDILNCTTGLSACQELSSKFLDFFSLALRPAVWCSVVQFLLSIIAAISEKSSTSFKKNEIFFFGG